MGIEAPDGAGATIDVARLAASRTHLRLDGAIEIDGEPAIRARFISRDPEAHLMDEAIGELVLRLGEHLRWYSLDKLEEFDGIPFFVPMPEMKRSQLR